MDLHLDELEAAQVIRQAATQPELEYIFHHTLIQEVVYESLLKGDRRRLHCLIGEVLESLSPDGIASRETAPLLGHHFFEGGEDERAEKYFALAGDLALSQYAVAEAIEHYSRAVELAERRQDNAECLRLYRARGVAYDIRGEFDAARTDYLSALGAARLVGDRRAEWQGLIDLGFLWGSRDYSHTGDYFLEALDLARAMGDPATLGHSLNRIGNWHANVEQPDEALAYHREALTIFEGLDDRQGLAETHDLLGITHLIRADWPGGADHYQRAMQLFWELDDRRGLVSSLGTMTLRDASYMIDSVAPDAAAVAASNRIGEMALEIAREIGWRAGEAYVLFNLTMTLGPQGDYARALAYVQQALQIAQDIDHRQWMAAGHYTIGMLYRDLLAWPEAERHLERARELAQQTGSAYWFLVVTGSLASAIIRHSRGAVPWWNERDELRADVRSGGTHHNLARAKALLDTVISPSSPMQTVGQRTCWYARAELEVLCGEPEEALRIVQTLEVSGPDAEPGVKHLAPRLLQLRGRALVALARTSEAKDAFRAAQEVAGRQGMRWMLWRIGVDLGWLCTRMGETDEAEREFSTARAIVEDLAGNVPDEALKQNFVETALRMMQPVEEKT